MKTPENRPLERLLRIFEEVREINPEMPAHTVLAFLMIGSFMPEGITQHELGRSLGLSASVTQRNVSYLADWRGPEVPGYGLVESVMLPTDKRHRLLKLTKKGKATLERLTELLEWVCG